MTVDRMRDADAEWRHERAQAETVMCEECHQPAGETCLNLSDGRPLGKLPAHHRRITAGLASDYPREVS